MGNKIIRKRELSVSAVGSQQDPAEDQKTKEMGVSDVTPAQSAEQLDVKLGQEVSQTPGLPNEECVVAPEPMPEACVEVDFETASGKEKDASLVSSPSLDQSTPISPPQATITPPYETAIPEDEFADVPVVEEPADDIDASVSAALDPHIELKAGHAGKLETRFDGNSEQEESLSACLKELSLPGSDPDLIDNSPLDMGGSAVLIHGSEDP